MRMIQVAKYIFIIVVIRNHFYTKIVGSLNNKYVLVGCINLYNFFWFLGAFAKLRKATSISFVMPAYLSIRPSVHPRGRNRLSLVGFSRNLIFEYFSKICRENSSLVNIG